MTSEGAGSSALILSGSVGKGHDVVAETCAAALAEVGWVSEVVDAMALMGGPAHGAADAVFRTLLAVPGAYDAFHFRVLRAGGRVADALDDAAARRLAPGLERQLRRVRPRLVISVFATGAAGMDRVRPRHPGVASVVFCTDAGPHRLWVHPSTDLFLVTDRVSEGFVRMHRPDARVAVLPSAARPVFHHPPDAAEARAELAVPEGASCVLLMAGSWGLAPLDRLAGALAGDGHTVLAVAGSNGRLHRRLEAVAARHRGVTAIGMTDRVETLMAAADVVVTTPGDTCTEARLVGRPLLLLDTVPGHGRENLQLEMARGADPVTTDPQAVVAAVRRVIRRRGAAPPPVDAAARDAAAGGMVSWNEQFRCALRPIIGEAI